jgi:hypothetical protein
MPFKSVHGAVAALLVIALAPPSTAATELEMKFATLLVADEVGAGYNRSLFPHWIDADRDGCNARYEVLITEAVVAPAIGARCRLTGGVWISAFDNRRITNPSLLDVDHFVPLAEAWRSGARNWTAQQRIDFANDLDLPESLIAVSRSTNRAKSDSDVANWLPPNSNYRCEYLRSWVVVKAKWQLRVDLRERNALESGLLQCGLLSGRTAPKFVTDAKTPNLKPVIMKYRNCTLAKAAGVTPIRRDRDPALYRVNTHLDRDKDGIACE